MALRLDLGCGRNKREGFTGVDASAECGADIVHDLTVFPFPFADGEVEEIHCSHFLEHLTGKERIGFMDECWRILKPGAKMTVITPYWTSTRAIQDPTHQWPPICELSYYYFNKAWREKSQIEHYGIKCNFDFAFQYLIDDDLKVMEEKAQMVAFKHYNNAILDLYVTLTKNPA